MKITRKQAGYLSVLVVALGALAYDQLSSGASPAKVAAAAHPVAGLLDTARKGALPNQESDLLATANLAARLRGISANGQLQAVSPDRDAFSIPAAWIASKLEVATNSITNTTVTSVDQFRQVHHLKAVISQGQLSMVVVDSQLLQVGQELDGYRLISINSRSARFVAGGVPATLSLGGDASAQIPAEN